MHAHLLVVEGKEEKRGPRQRPEVRHAVIRREKNRERARVNGCKAVRRRSASL